MAEEIENLKAQLTEANETLRAIREGEVDAIVVSGDKGEQLYSTLGADLVYRLIVETMKEAALTLTFEGRILFCNAQFGELLGRSLDQIVGRTLQDFVSPDNRSALERLLGASESHPVKLRLVLEGASGKPVPAYVSSTILQQPDGPSLCMVAADLTELENSTAIIQQLRVQRESLREANERLRVQSEQLQELNQDRGRLLASERSARIEADRANRMKDEFLAMLSHELRNPLSTIMSSVELWLRGAKDPVSEHAGKVARRQVAHIARLMDDLLDTARITRGKVELRRRPVDLREIVRDAGETIALSAALKKQEATVSVADDPIPLDGDPDRLQQVVGNLLNNASKYTPAGGHISVNAGIEGEQAVIRVKDDGIGISEEMLPHIFEMFFQARRKPDRAQGGLGLGLTLARLLVDLHGGTVEALSAGDGKGAEFVVRLPLSLKSLEVSKIAESDAFFQTRSTAAAPENIRASRSSSKRRILVVEDNADAAEMLAIILRMEGHHVKAVHDGSAAWRLALEWNPEVVLLDIGLPGMDGYEVARRFKHEPGLSGMTLVALTGYGQEEDRQRARKAGFDYHLVKPVDMDAVQRMLEEIPPASH